MSKFNFVLTQLFGRIAPVAISGALLMTSAVAHAQTTTKNYQPNPSDLDDLDHHSAYTWKLSNIDLSDKQIVSAKLTFDNIANWTTETNVLHIHLLDTARNSGVASFLDDNPNHDHVTDYTDDFTSSRYHHGKDATGANATWLVSSSTSDTLLANPSFTTTPTDWTYDFGANNKIDILTQYLLNGNNVAFGFDPDCHYNNDGVTFTLITKPGKNGHSLTAVPEAGSLPMLVLGCMGMIGGVLVRRRK